MKLSLSSLPMESECIGVLTFDNTQNIANQGSSGELWCSHSHD